MSAIRDIIEKAGGSFRAAPNKATFWLPLELTKDAGYLADFIQLVEDAGKTIRKVENRDHSDTSSWSLWRFVGERKKFRVVKVHDRSAPGGVNPRLVIEVHPDGRLVIRESKRKVFYETTVAAVYVRCILQELNRKERERRQARKASRTSRKR